MLTAAQLDSLPGPVLELYERYQQSVIDDICRRLAGLHYDSAAWQVQRLSESGALYEGILEKLAGVTGQSEAELRGIFERAGVKAMKFDDDLYRQAGLSPVPLNLSPAMISVLKAGLVKTGGLMRNLTQTTAIAGQQAFISASDLAYMQITQGSFSYDQAIRAAVKQVADQGLSVIQFNGRRDQLDVAMRRSVLTGVNQTVGKLQEARADEMGVDLVQTSAHAGARNTGTGPANHEGWQGKIFSRSGTNGQYPNFVEKTGYGTGPGLCGFGCRHSFFPFFPGISQNAYDQATLDEYADRTVTYNKQEMDFYSATQEQRGIERKIRKWKRQANAMDAAKVNNSPEVEAVKYYQAQMRKFIKETGIVRQRTREQVYG
jgi:hypothetical protein